MKNLIKCLLLGVVSSAVVSCGGVCSSNETGGYHPASIDMDPITIDNTGVIPVFGLASTTTVVYVHNNLNETISGIKYTSQDNVEARAMSARVRLFLKRLMGSNSIDNFIDSKSAVTCATIGAHSSCALTIHTPQMDSWGEQGSAVLKATYNYKGSTLQFSNIANYQVFDNTITSGVQFASNVVIDGFGHKNGYGTVYAYGSGIAQTYKVTNVSTTQKPVTIISGDISGTDMASNQVQAIELDATTVNDLSYIGSLVLDSKSNAGSLSFKATSSFSVAPTNNGAYLIGSLVPVINTAITTSGTAYIVNSGNESANVSLGAMPTGMTLVNNGCSSGPLLPNVSCTITFTVVQGTGSGTIPVSYTTVGNSAVTQLPIVVNWFNSSGPLLSMSADPSSAIFNSGESFASVITIKNVGGYTVSNLNTAYLVGPTSPVSATIPSTSDHCSGQSLEVN